MGISENRYFENLNIINARVVLNKKTLGVSADFNVNFITDLICARCLSTFKREFSESLHLDYIAGKDPLLSSEKVELKSGDIDRVYYIGPDIDISIGIRETILLALPTVPLCKEDCLGLCPKCGKNLNKGRCNCKTEPVGIFTPKTKNV